MCLDALEAGCLKRFLHSAQYAYVHELRVKASHDLSVDYFQVLRKLGEGGFGQVLEVVKRDCGKRYAMKVMEKAKLSECFGSELWEAVVQCERDVLGSLRHPLMINLAYAYQNIEYLWLVMDICDGGDLSAFGANRQDEDSKLTSDQVHFVGLEVVAMLSHLHELGILFRDLKPSNLLLDSDGHARLVDFGTAKMATVALSRSGPEGEGAAGTGTGTGSGTDTAGGQAGGQAGGEGGGSNGGGRVVPPTSREFCGSVPYMAPEVANVEETDVPYGYACDLFSFGVILYELIEQSYPYGAEPEYKDVESEFRQPRLVDEATKAEIPHLYDLLAGLLDWDPRSRLGGGDPARGASRP